jgi:hypothetical protein
MQRSGVGRRGVVVIDEYLGAVGPGWPRPRRVIEETT